MISFIVPVKNGLSYTRALVESVRASDPEVDVEWVIVDSGSTDGTLEYCAEVGARVVPFRRQPFNYCAALNAGAAVAGGDLWIMSNNDIEVRAPGSLALAERAFREWPVLEVASPGREGGAEVEFQLNWIYGACWAVRPEAFRGWGGMPEEVSGYGYDELWTTLRCWHDGRALAYLNGWQVFHHGSVTFAGTGGNTTAAMRRNLSRLLAVMEAPDLDRGSDPLAIVYALFQRELERTPPLLAVDDTWKAELAGQGYAGAKVIPPGAPDRSGVARVVSTGPREPRQWLPWLANELLLQPDAPAVGGGGVYAVRDGALPFDPAQAKSVGPSPPPLPPPMPVRKHTLRERIAAAVHNWRHRKTELPPEW